MMINLFKFITEYIWVINMSFYKMFAKLNAVTNLISKIHVWIHKFQLTLHQVKKFYNLVH